MVLQIMARAVKVSEARARERGRERYLEGERERERARARARVYVYFTRAVFGCTRCAGSSMSFTCRFERNFHPAAVFPCLAPGALYFPER